MHRRIGWSLLLALFLFAAHSNAQEDASKGDSGYTKTREAIKRAKTLTYTMMSFQQGDDGAMEVGYVDRIEHRTPSFWRHTALDGKGKVASIHIVDTTAKKQLYLDMKSKSATWLPQPIHVYGDVGMLDWLGAFVKEMPSRASGQRDTGDGKADVFEAKHAELWFDKESNLIGVSVPGSDPEFTTKLADLNKMPKGLRPGKTVGRVYKDIKYGVTFDKDRFEMRVPDGFTVMEPPTLTGQPKE